jgi:hypothetical protein
VVSAKEKRRRRAQERSKAQSASMLPEESDKPRGMRRKILNKPLHSARTGSHAPPKKRPCCQRNSSQGPGLNELLLSNKFCTGQFRFDLVY